MKVIDFVNKLKELGYNGETTLGFYCINGDTGDAYELKIEEVEDTDRECGVDSIGVVFAKPKDYIESECEILRINLREELNKTIDRLL